MARSGSRCTPRTRCFVKDSAGKTWKTCWPISDSRQGREQVGRGHRAVGSHVTLTLLYSAPPRTPHRQHPHDDGCRDDVLRHERTDRQDRRAGERSARRLGEHPQVREKGDKQRPGGDDLHLTARRLRDLTVLDDQNEQRAGLYQGGKVYGGYGPYGYGAYRSNDGAVRIEVGPKYLRDEAQVYVNEAHVGVVDDFDGFFQRLSLTPGEYDIEIRLDGYQTLQTRIFVRRGSTYKIRESLHPVVAN